MKILLIVFATAILTADAFMHLPGMYVTNYCAEMKDGMLTVTYEGKQVRGDVALENGMIIKSNGEIIKKDGTKFLLNPGECLDKDGNLISSDPEKKSKLEPY